MKSVVALALVAACHSSSTPAAPTPAPSAFQPTSFVAKVSGTGRPVILIPGLGCPGAVWDETVAHLGPKFSTHVLTLAGFAGQPPIEQPLSATVRGELAQYIRDRHLDHPVIIGHSLGGVIAYWLAATEPDLVGPTIVVDAAPAIGAGQDPAGAAQMRDATIASTDEAFAAQTRGFLGGMSKDAKRMAPILDAAVRSDHKTMGNAFYELFTTDLREQVKNIKAPLLLVLADAPYQGMLSAQAEVIPHHQIEVVKGTKHFVMFDDPDGFFRVVDAFLAAH